MTITPKAFEGSTTGHATLVSREAPKINGSASAFIGLVVTLGLIIVLALLAVAFLLLWDSDSSSTHDQSAHRTRRYQKAGAEGGFLLRLRSVFGRLFHRQKQDAPSTTEVLKPGVQTRRFFTRAGSSSDSAEDPEVGDNIKPLPRNRHHLEQIPEMFDIPDPPMSTKTSQPTIQSYKRISRLNSNISTTTSNTDAQQSTSIPYHDPYAPKPQQSISSNFYSHVSPSSVISSASSSPPSGSYLRTLSPEPICSDSHLDDGKGRPFATQSGASMVTLEGGTKFVEGL